MANDLNYKANSSRWHGHQLAKYSTLRALSNCKNSLKSGGSWIVANHNLTHKFDSLKPLRRCFRRSVFSIVFLLAQSSGIENSFIHSQCIHRAHKKSSTQFHLSLHDTARIGNRNVWATNATHLFSRCTPMSVRAVEVVVGVLHSEVWKMPNDNEVTPIT